MTSLNGRQIEQLRNALLSAFPSDSRLKELAFFGLEKNLDEVEGGDLAARAFNLIRWAISVGRLKDLIVDASDRIPGNAQLRSIADELLPLVAAAPTTQETRSIEATSSDSISRGLYALSELMRDPLARSLISEFSWRLADGHKQISIMGDYKDIHDLLHRLRSECYEPAIKALDLAAHNLDSVRDDFTFYKQSLRTIVTSIKQVRTRSVVVKKETSWITDLESLFGEIRFDSDTTLDPITLKRGLRRLSQLITDNSFRINTLLKSAAVALNLERLLQLLTAVQQKLAPLNLESERFDRFTLGLRDLRKVALSLGHLVDSHDEWQFVENIVCRIEELLDTHTQQFFSDIQVQWPTLKLRTAKVFRPKHYSSSDFAFTVNRLEAAINSCDTVATEKCFRYYRREVFLQFYMIDFTLKQQCHELQKLGEPINAVLQVIQ